MLKQSFLICIFVYYMNLNKKIKYTVRIIIWSVLGLYMTLLVLLNVPFVQKKLSAVASHELSNLLHTEVSVGRLDVGLLNRIIIENVLLKDQQGESLLKIARLSANFEYTPLLEGKILINSVQLFGFNIQAYRDSLKAVPNYQFVLDALASKDTVEKESNLDLRINSVLIRRGRVSYDVYSIPPTPNKFNANHLQVKNLAATISLKALKKDSVNAIIKRLTFDEESGFSLKRLNLKFNANAERTLIKDFNLELPKSSLTAKEIKLQYDSLTALSQLADNVTLNANLKIKWTPNDVSSFVPVLRHVNRPIHGDILLKTEGKNLKIEHLKIEDPNHFYFHAKTEVRDWDKGRDMHIYAKIPKLHLTEKGASYLKEQSSGATSILEKFEFIHLEGELKGKLSSLNLQTSLKTGAGDVLADGTLLIGNDYSRSYTGKLIGTDVNLAKITQNPDEFGLINFLFELKGFNYKNQYPETNIKGLIKSFDYRKYHYENITLDGEYKDGGFMGDLVLNDENAKVQLKGYFNSVQKNPVYNLQASVKDFSPHKLNLSKKHEDKALSFNLTADFNGKDIDDINGMIQLDNLRMMHKDSTEYELDRLSISAQNKAQQNVISISSPFFNANVNGDFRFYTIPGSIVQALEQYLPALIHSKKKSKTTIDNDFTFEAELKDATFFNKLLQIPLEMHMPAHIKGHLQHHSDDLHIEGSFPKFTYNGTLYESGVLQCGNRDDKLNLMARGSMLLKSGAMVNVSIQSQAKDNQLKTLVNWGNNTNITYGGTLSTSTRFTESENVKPKLRTDIEINPSRLVLNDTIWHVHPAHIAIDSGKVSINRFLLDRPNQALMIDGVISKEEKDSCNIDLHNLKVEYILDIVRFDDVLFGGKASGRATLKHVLKQPGIKACLHVQDFTVNKALLGNAVIKGEWDDTIEGIRIDADVEENDSIRTNIDGYVSLKRNELDLLINAKNTNLKLIHPYIEDIFNPFSGRGTGKVRLFGDFKHLDLEGGLRANLAAKIDVLHTGFKVLNDSVTITPGKFDFNKIHVLDDEGNNGIVNGYVAHTKLKNIMYDFNISSENLLLYNTKEPDDMPFYGKVFANGDVSLKGGNNAMYIDAFFGTAPHTTFTYVNGYNSEASNNQFITFVDKTPKRVRDVVKTKIYHYSDAAKKEEEEGPPMDLHINMMIDATPNGSMKVIMDPISGDAITARGNGNLKVNFYNKGDFRMFGNYTIENGKYKLSMQEVIRKDFTLQQGGVITFSGDPYLANLDLQAIYTVNSASLSDLTTDASLSQSTVKVNCIMNINGNLASPTLNFDLDLPAVSEEDKELVRNATSTDEQMNTQIIYLLGIGKFYAYDYDNSRSQSNATSSLAFNTLSGQLNNILSQWMENKNWNLGANLSTGEKGWTDVEAEAMLSGRLLNNRLLVNGNFGYRENAMANSNFVGDFEAIWLLTKNGDFRLRGYNQTNDRYFTKSTLTTQGIGFIYKKDFNRWSDLFNWMFHKRKGKKEKELPIPIPDYPSQFNQEKGQEESKPKAQQKRERSVEVVPESFITFSPIE